MDSKGEAARQQSLAEYDILDTAPEQVFDDLTILASQICGVPIALVTLIDGTRNWFKSKVGLDIPQAPRETSFCTHTIQQRELLVIPDAQQDQRFAANPYVVGDPNIRFYAGYPLISREGEGIGSFCVIDVQPKELTEVQRNALEALGRQVQTQLELRRRLREHQEALEAQKASEERFREFADNVDDVLWTVDVDTGKFTFVSPSYEKLWERPVESLYADASSFLEQVHPDDREKARAQWDQKSEVDEDYRLLRRDGSICWVRVRAFPRYNEQGRLHRISGIATDLTKQKKAETERDKFFQASADLLSIHRIGETTYRQMNEAWERTLGYSRDEFSQGKMIQLVHPDDAAATEAVLAGLAKGRDIIGFRNRYRHKNGSWVWLEWQALAPPPGEDLVYTVARDVTVQAEAVEKLRLKSHELERVFNVFPDLFFQLDQDGLILDYHGGYATEGGPFSRNCVGLYFRDILPAEIAARLKQAREEARRTHALQQIEFTFPGTGGDRSFEVRVLSDDGREVIVVIRDITARSLADRAQLEAKQAAESANRSKSEFLASMSHELRTPLNAVLNISESMGEGVYGDLNDKQRHSLQTISESGRHLLGLINDILDLSKIEAGKVELSLARVSVQAVCEASLRLVREQALHKSQEVVLSISPQVKGLDADERKLKQILVNLLSNAIKFTPKSGRIGLEVAAAEDMIAFTVWDTGIGISPDNQKKLFQPFVQLDSKLSREYAGTGLGLSLAQRLAGLHHGWVEVKSVAGEGSRFTAYIPAAHPELGVPAREKTQRLPLGIAPAVGQQPRVLLVEDTAANRECIGDYLGAKGFHVQLAVNGMEAIRLASAEAPDIILMDIQMSGMDGFEAIRLLREKPKLTKTPIVALTALAMDGDSERCLAAGATHYMSKPVALRELVATVSAILDESSSEVSSADRIVS